MAKVKAYFEGIKDVILEELDKAEKSIFVCMAWFTDNELLDMLIKKLEEGVSVEIVLFETEGNLFRATKNVNTKLENLINYRARLDRFVDSKGQLTLIEQPSGQMHNKFAVVDEIKTITGSYNWSFNANNYNKENVVVIEDSDIAAQFHEEYIKIRTVQFDEIMKANYPSCTEQGCNGNVFKIKVIDHREKNKYWQNDTFTLGICTHDPSHIVKLEETVETDFYGDLMEYEWEAMEPMLEGLSSNQQLNLFRKNVYNQIAKTLASRIDVFVENGSHDMLGVYKIARDMDMEGEFDEFDVIWEHDLIKDVHVEFYQDDIIELINDW